MPACRENIESYTKLEFGAFVGEMSRSMAGNSTRGTERIARRRRPTVSHLTSRESEVLLWVANGKAAWEIAEILDIAKRTVDEHVQTAVRKLGATNRPHAVALALRDGLIKL